MADHQAVERRLVSKPVPGPGMPSPGSVAQQEARHRGALGIRTRTTRAGHLLLHGLATVTVDPIIRAVAIATIPDRALGREVSLPGNSRRQVPAPAIQDIPATLLMEQHLAWELRLVYHRRLAPWVLLPVCLLGLMLSFSSTPVQELPPLLRLRPTVRLHLRATSPRLPRLPEHRSRLRVWIWIVGGFRALIDWQNVNVLLGSPDSFL